MFRAPRLLGLAIVAALAAAPPAFARLIHLHAVLTPREGTAPGSGGHRAGTRQIALILPARDAAPGGLFVATFNTLTHRLRYKVTWHDLAGRILSATIDGPLDHERSRTLVHLRIRQDGRIEGSARLGGRTEALVRRGDAELVIATEADRSGEIGGRIETGRPPRR